MNEVNNEKKKFSISKKVRYGSSALTFTVLFVVFVLLINVVLSVVDEKTGGLYIDMTTHDLYTISDESKAALKNVTQPIEIIFAKPKDVIEGMAFMSDVNKLCEKYANLYDNITMSYHDILSEVAYFNKFKTTSADEIKADSIIVYCPSTGLSRIFSYARMFKISDTTGRVVAFDGESKLTNAFLSVTGNAGKTLKAGFISGHNEQINDVLKVFLEENGYLVDTVDLKKSSSTELKQYDLLIVCEPRNDFSGRNMGGVNEIEMLRSYVMEDFGNLMFFVGYSGNNMPELFALLEENFGVKVNNSAIVVEGDSNAIPQTSGISFYGTYSTDKNSYGYNIHKSFSQSQTGSYPLFEACSNLKIINKDSSYFQVSPIIVTSDEAVSFDGQTQTPFPGAPLMTLSRYIRLVDSMDKTANVVVCSSSTFPYYLEEQAFSNSDILKSVLVEINDASVLADIPYKLVDDNSIIVRKDDKDDMTMYLGFVFPIIILVVGTVVFIKRKYL